MKKFLSYLEEQLEIDEVSYKGLSNYRKAAKDDIKNIDKEAKKIPYRGFTEKQLKQHDRLIDKKLNRIKGIDQAYKKMRGKNPGQYPVEEVTQYKNMDGSPAGASIVRALEKGKEQRKAYEKGTRGQKAADTRKYYKMLDKMRKG
tara:strand:+ start:154 stop:588 length:435 start_codon:yes stop_codon:yes gene_type:complete